jgi:uncharacterized protein YcbX
MADLVLTGIWTYPVKSLGGVSHRSARVFGKGLEDDRRWMLIDAEHRFMTQRELPTMALFKVSLRDDGIAIRFGDDVLGLPRLPLSTTSPVRARVWDDEVEVCEVSEAHSRWFSDRLGISCQLVHFPEVNERNVDSDFQQENEQVSLADGFPYLIIGQASLDALNEKLASPIPMNRFRPNFVFDGAPPHDEDNWGEFCIGDVKFVGVKPCARCTIPTVNQDTAERGAEPSRTLATYRKRNNNIYFGQNLLARSGGEVGVGDKVTIQTSNASLSSLDNTVLH